MTRKHYRAIAKAIARNMRLADEAESIVIDSIIHSLADVMQEDNARFDRDKFVAACWCEGNVRGYKSLQS